MHEETTQNCMGNVSHGRGHVKHLEALSYILYDGQVKYNNEINQTHDGSVREDMRAGS